MANPETPATAKTFRIDYVVYSFAFGVELPFSRKVDALSAEDAIARFKAGNAVAEKLVATELPGAFEAAYKAGQRELDRAERALPRNPGVL